MHIRCRQVAIAGFQITIDVVRHREKMNYYTVHMMHKPGVNLDNIPLFRGPQIFLQITIFFTLVIHPDYK